MLPNKIRRVRFVSSLADSYYDYMFILFADERGKLMDGEFIYYNLNFDSPTLHDEQYYD